MENELTSFNYLINTRKDGFCINHRPTFLKIPESGSTLQRKSDNWDHNKTFFGISMQKIM